MSETAPERFPTDEDIRRAIDAARYRALDLDDLSGRAGAPLPDMYETLGPDGVKRLRIARPVIDRAIRKAGRAGP